jgi:DNA-binding winged helix-turn-helix (wHTH) protein/TolB-like protein/Flp pilus assembly protein TadD
MTSPANKVFEFGPFRLDATERVLLRDGRPVPLTLKAFDVLIVLVENSGHIVEKDALMNRVWPDSFVEEGNLKVTVSMLRKALEDNDGTNRYIETVPRRGYRFATEIKESSAGIDLVLHERTRQSITIDEVGMPGNPTRRRSVPFLLIGVLLVVLVGGFFLLRTRNRSSSVSAAPITSIAVLPFKPLVAAARDESLELGIAETLITRLTSLHAIKVPPTTAVRKYNRIDQDPLAAGRDLKVESVLDGSLQREGNRIRVMVRLVRVADGETLWSDRFDEDITEILTLQDRIAGKLVAALSVKLTGDQRELLVKHYTQSTQAYELYLKGNFSSRVEARLNKSLEYYEEAIKLDPRYALAYTGLADTYVRLSLQNVLRPAESLPKAGAAAMKALELDERLVEAHITLGIYKFLYEWNFAEAERQFKRALELDPDNNWAHSEYASYLARMRRFDEAINERKRALDLAPPNPADLSNLAYAYDLAGRYDEALTHFQRAIQMNPRFPWAHLGIARVYFHLGRFEEAIAELNTSISLSDGNLGAIAALGHTYAVAGKRDEARKVVTDLEERAKTKYVPAYLIAIVYAGLGDRDQTFAWLERAYEERYPGLTLLGNDPVFDRVRPDPRFANLMRRIGFSS